MGATGSPRPSPAESLSRLVSDASALPECKGPLRRPCNDTARRLKLLCPLFEELRDGPGVVPEEEDASLAALERVVGSAVDLVRVVEDGSRMVQAMECEKIVSRFAKVTEQLEEALGALSYNKLDIPGEVKEQVELIHNQLKRAKENKDSLDIQLSKDLLSPNIEKITDPSILGLLSEKLCLRTTDDIKREYTALHEMNSANGGHPPQEVNALLALLKNIEDRVSRDGPITDAPDLPKLRSPIIPDDFRCPISLELMKDPVIVSTGQTYERACIQKWLNSGHKTCPKTHQQLSHTSLTPNYVLKSLISQWCESNGLEPPKLADSQDSATSNSNSDCVQPCINLLLQKLKRGSIEEQRRAAGQLRLLAKRNADNRVCIADAGAIPLLIDRLSSEDPRIQEHAVTALLNLSINETNKRLIVHARALPEIVKVLKNGSMEARENAAAALFSLSVIDVNKIAIGEAGAIPALVDLLCEGSPRGKKDAATAIFNLSIYPMNKVKAVEAGIIVHLMKMLVDPSGGMIDEALAVLAILATHNEGKLAIAQSKPIPTLVKLLRTGSPRNRENAVAVLSSLCSDDPEQLTIAERCEMEETLKELSDSGTDRAKRKAANLLELLRQSRET